MCIVLETTCNHATGCGSPAQSHRVIDSPHSIRSRLLAPAGPKQLSFAVDARLEANCQSFDALAVPKALPKRDWPRDEIYIDDDDLEGSGGGKGEVRDDLESSGSGNGPTDDEDNIGSDPYPETPVEETTIRKESAPPAPPPPDTTITQTPPPPEDPVDKYPSMNRKHDERATSFFAQPGILAAVIGGAVVGLLCAILVVMFIVYRMRKKDEGSYALDEPKRSPTVNSYTKNSNREFYA
ncbi:Syndecan [Gryllus bimaculatus]|nr:Syndecan [Gryllus bimaculatus]